MRTSLKRPMLLWAPGVWLCIISALSGQSPDQPKPGSDVLLFNDGERLTGHFVKSTGASLTFHSDALGDITVAWKKVKELNTSVKVAVIPKGVRIRKPSDAGGIARGTLTVQDQQVHLAAPAPTPPPMPVADTGQIVDEAGFEKALERAPILRSLEREPHQRSRSGERHAR